MVTVDAKLMRYVGAEKCRVGNIYAGNKCGKQAEVVTVLTASNGWSNVSQPRCRADAELLLGDLLND